MTPPASSKVPFAEKMGFGLGELGNNLFWQFFMYFQLFFYTDVFKIAEGVEAAAVAGHMFLVVKVVDAVVDILVGIMADRTKTRWGKYRPYMLWGALPFTVAGLLAFTTPDMASNSKLVYAYVTYTFLMMMYSFVSIPQNSLLGVMTDDGQERTVLSKYKFLFAFTAGVIVQFATPILVKHLGGDNIAKGYQLTVLVYGIVAFVGFIVAFLSVRERVSPPADQQPNLALDGKNLVTNWPWLVLVAVTFPYILHIAIRSQSFVYYFKYLVKEWHVDLPFMGPQVFGYGTIMAIYLIMGTLLTIVGTLMVPTITRYLGKKGAMIACVGTSSVICAIYYIVPTSNVELIMALQVAASLSLGPTSAILWPMYADCADYSEWKNRRRATALVFAAAIFAQKVGWAAAADVQGKIMRATGYIPDSELTPQAVNGLLLTNTLIPAGFGLVAVLILLVYPLNQKRLQTIEDELRSRRQET
ncbi:MAG: glycoside-pentoside-hexuronide (GPH):cation symporter [Opitutaceae bacterium]|nr:glycoside-pentoside-hexuronide (GPH):cation symporter [Opitutaceae bacterium]